MPAAPRAECIAVTPEEDPADEDKENYLSPRGADEGEGSRESTGATHTPIVSVLCLQTVGGRWEENEEVGQTLGNRKY